MAISGLGSGIGATLGDGTDTYTDLISIGVGGQTCDVTDISSSGSANQFMEFLPGLLNPGVIICVLRYGSTLGTAAVTYPAKLRTTFQAREIDTWTIAFPGGATWDCTGFIIKLNRGVQYRGGQTYQVTIKCTGAPSYTEAV